MTPLDSRVSLLQGSYCPGAVPRTTITQEMHLVRGPTSMLQPLTQILSCTQLITILGVWYHRISPVPSLALADITTVFRWTTMRPLVWHWRSMRGKLFLNIVDVEPPDANGVIISLSSVRTIMTSTALKQRPTVLVAWDNSSVHDFDHQIWTPDMSRVSVTVHPFEHASLWIHWV